MCVCIGVFPFVFPLFGFYYLLIFYSAVSYKLLIPPSVFFISLYFIKVTSLCST